jgi:hypothetical protein
MIQAAGFGQKPPEDFAHCNSPLFYEKQPLRKRHFKSRKFLLSVIISL